MGWAEAIKGFLIAFPQIVGAIRDLGAQIKAAAEAAQNQKLQEIRNAQHQLTIEVQRVVSDQDRVALVQRIAELERRL